MEKIKKIIIALMISLFSVTADYIPAPKESTTLLNDMEDNADEHMFI